jgi:hypothetical protein
MNSLETIHQSLVNGQRRQMVKQIDEYGVYDFWEDYSNYLEERYYCDDLAFKLHFTDATIAYFRIKNR